jgi:glyoxylase-like metal-dependent hydrolase (beta-lactamase superfamily II)
MEHYEMTAEKVEVAAFFDEATYTVSYVVWDTITREAAIIDPVLDYDPHSGRIATRSADALLAFVQKSGLKVGYILETHAHADHLTAGAYLRAKTGAPIGIGARIGEVQAIFRKRFNVTDVSQDGTEFDERFADGATRSLGTLTIKVLHTPGHTPACVTYLIGDTAFVGDTLFMPDYGTARTDFPGGDTHALYHSIQRIFGLPDETRLFMCHDYKAPGRDHYAWETTVAEERAKNIHIHQGIGEDEFVAMRQARDETLAPPALLLPSIQVNIRAGALPPAEANGTRYLKTPLTVPADFAATLD